MRWSKVAMATAVLLVFVLSQGLLSAREDQLVYKKKYAMGTVFEIAAYGPSPKHVSQAIDQAFKEVVRLDHIMSGYIPESDLSRINRTAHFRPEPIPHDLYQVIKQSLLYSRMSGGKFDITVGPLARAWKAEIQDGKPPSPAEEESLRRCVGWRNVTLIPPDKIELRSPCMAIDLGAIGKGYAVDRAAEVLRSYAIRRALISAGGSTIYGMGAPPGKQAWVVQLRDPTRKLNPEVRLNGNSVSTSEQTRDPEPHGAPFGHIIDPATGVPVRTAYSVSAVAPTATASDALSTTLLLMGPVNGKSLVSKLSQVAVLWISSQGKTETLSTGPRISISRNGGLNQ